MNDLSKKYCNSLTKYSRFNTRVVYIGGLPLGGNYPIRIQSMTTTDTMNTVATVEQTIRMIKSGCDYVRITAPSINEAKNLEEIKKELRKRGYSVPLIADIHFTPNAAELAARIVEKVRVNPGNYIDKKKFQLLEYNDNEYQLEIQRIYERFSPLVKICKEHGTAIRIGANHGSLSDRIMSRYGDTPLGMVESALEFVRVCRDHDFHNIVLSMKSSNPQVMVQAYRLLVNKMIEEDMNYPLHLGVTEAGGGEDGRIKSALGIGALLEDGLGDTIRVSLTEDPEFEAPVAIALARRYSYRKGHKPITPYNENLFSPFEYKKRESVEVMGTGAKNVPVVVADFLQYPIKTPADLAQIGYFYDEITDKWSMNDSAPDFAFLKDKIPSFDLPHGLRGIVDLSVWDQSMLSKRIYPILPSYEYLSNKVESPFFFVTLRIDDLNEEFIQAIKNDSGVIIVAYTYNAHAYPELRKLFITLIENGISNPVIISREIDNISDEVLPIYPAIDFGALLIDGYGDGVWLRFARQLRVGDINRVLFGILQAARVRISKTEYIACPSCGRTLFDLQETTEMIRKQTSHLKGVKIAIMGCIVNGPGEMADADYGYVGSGPGKITLYRGKEVVKKSIVKEGAVNELINLIKEDNKWVEPVV